MCYYLNPKRLWQGNGTATLILFMHANNTCHLLQKVYIIISFDAYSNQRSTFVHMLFIKQLNTRLEELLKVTQPFSGRIRI